MNEVIDGLIQAELNELDDMRAAANSENKEKPSTEVADHSTISPPSATADVAMSNNTAGDESPRRHHESKKTRQRRLHEAERFITFTDAVVAIAMTLLILPLQEAASSWGEGETEWTASDFFSENRHKVGALALSFCVIAMYWNGHDSMFQVRRIFISWIGCPPSHLGSCCLFAKPVTPAHDLELA
jgi:hypothetical protein